MLNDFREFATENARQEFGGSQRLKIVTHWAHWETSVDRWGELETACGKRVKKLYVVGSPTCPECKAAAEAYDNLQIG